MRIPRWPTWIVAAFLVSLLAVERSLAQDSPALRPLQLRCEFDADPLGIDVPNPRLSWIVTSEPRNSRQSAFQILVASSLPLLHQNHGDLWDSGRVESNETSHIETNGSELSSSQQVHWKVRVWADIRHPTADSPSAWSEPATWTMGLVDEDDWHGHWIVAPWESEALLLRHEFAVKPGLARAVLHVGGLGHCEPRLNGQRVGENLLSPGWSKYDRTCLYETFDITSQLDEGTNAIGLALGDGMYHTERRHRFSKFQGTFGPLRARVELVLEYGDGSQEFITTDDDWRVSRGPVTYNDIYGGEDFDARLVEPGWDAARFDDSHWAHAERLVRPKGRLRGHSVSAPPIREIEILEPLAVRRVDDGRDVIDMGQNASYMPRIAVSGPAGSTVRLTHAETLNDDGTINRASSGGNRGPAYWQYTKATDELETWFPQFFYAGCRYLQLDKFPAKHSPGILPDENSNSPGILPGENSNGPGILPAVEQLQGVVVHSISEPIGEFECSNELFNRIHTLIRWSKRSNMVSVLTYCPHREKLGWLGDCHLNVPGLQYEFDVSRILTKTMRDMADSQTDTGLVPNIAPEFTVFPGTFRAAAEWGTAVIMIPWQHYLATGDTRLLRDHYRTMQRYMEYLQSRAEDHLLDEGLGDWYDWVPDERPGVARLTPPRVTASAFYFYDAHILAKIAAVLEKNDDAREYSALADTIRDAWRREFRDTETGNYATGSQSSLALALAMGLAESDDRQRTLELLVQNVRDNGNAMTSGIVGFGSLLNALSDAGRADVVFDMLNRTEKPGYGFILETGATSMTEAWDGNHVASQNHYMFGQATEWFYKHLAGIQPDPAGPGYAKIIIRPNPVGDLKWASGSVHTIRGEVASRWRRDGRRLTLNVTIPANATATVYLPAAPDQPITEGGLPLDEIVEVEYRGRDGDRAILQIGSGRYQFESTL